MFLTTKQKFILDVLKKLGCVRRGQIYTLLRGRFEQANFKITQSSVDTMLWQLRMGTANVRLDDELVWLSGAQPDARRLEAVDVMLELTNGSPQVFNASIEPPRLLRFTYARPFSVASIDIAPPESLERGRTERIVLISDSGKAPEGLALPPKHFFAARQPDGTHRFYGSNGP